MTSPTIPVTGATSVYGIEYLLEGEPAYFFRAKMQRNSERLEALLQARAIAPPAAQDLAALSGRVGSLEGERAWTTYASTTYSAPLTTTGGTVPPAIASGQGSTAMLTFAAGAVPAGRLLEVEVRIPLLNVAANSSAYLRLVDSVGGVLDGIQVTAAAAAVAAPVRLRGDVVANGAARTVQLQAWFAGGSASISASTGAFAAVMMRHRTI